MAHLASYALPAIIALTSMGAFIMCLLVLRFGASALEEDPDEASRRLAWARAGYGVAAICFAVVALLAVIALPGRQAGSTPAPGGQTTAALEAKIEEQARELARLRETLSRLEASAPRGPRDQERRETAAASASGEPDRPASPAPPARVAAAPAPAPERPAPAPERAAPAPVAVRRAPESAAPPAKPTAEPPDEPDEAYALQPGAVARHLTATVQGTRVDVEARPLQDGYTGYIVRLRDQANRPVAGAQVILQGERPDGTPITATLRPAGEPGVHRVRVPVPADDGRGLRLRVVSPATRFEVSLAREVRW